MSKKEVLKKTTAFFSSIVISNDKSKSVHIFNG